MPKVSKSEVSQVKDFGVVEDRTQDLDDYMVNFVTIKQDHDLAGMLSGLPGGTCPCPHWGYVLKGELRVHYADHDEVIRAGDAFYMPPGHVPSSVAGTEIIQFSPAAQMRDVETAIMKHMQQMQGA